MLISTISPNIHSDQRHPSKGHSDRFYQHTEIHSIVCTCTMQLPRTRAWGVHLNFDNFQGGLLITVEHYDTAYAMRWASTGYWRATNGQKSARRDQHRQCFIFRTPTAVLIVKESPMFTFSSTSVDVTASNEPRPSPHWTRLGHDRETYECQRPPTTLAELCQAL